MKLMPKMRLEILAYLLFSLSVVVIVDLLLLLVVPEISFGSLVAGSILWMIFIYRSIHIHVSHSHYRNVIERQDVSHQHIRFSKKSIAEKIEILQALGFTRMGEASHQIKGMEGNLFVNWYLVNEAIPAIASVNKSGHVAFLTHFPENGLVITSHARAPQARYKNYLRISAPSGTLSEALETHKKHVMSQSKSYGTPVIINTVPELFMITQQIDATHKASMRYLERRVQLIRLTFLSVFFALLWGVLSFLFRLELSPIGLIVFVPLYMGYMYLIGYIMKKRRKGKPKKEDQHNKDPLHIAAIDYYSNSTTLL